MPLADLFRSPADAGESIDSTFSDHALLAGMLAFEAALAGALADAGVVTREAGDAARALCERWGRDDAALASVFDVDALAQAGRTAGTLAIPFVRALVDAVAREDRAAAACVHRGATSQDVMDTALVLELRRAVGALHGQLVAVGDAAAALAHAHRDTPMTGRTLLQAAVPISFGWKAAGWVAAIERGIGRLGRAGDEACMLQFGGAAGTLAALGEHAQPVAQALAARLGLRRPAISWHAGRDALAAVAAEVGITCGTLGKIGADIALLMQSEVAEAFEPTGAGRGGSSAMPHKRNPVGAMLAREASYRTPGLVSTMLAQLPIEHERGLGNWQRDWFTLRDLFGAASSAACAMAEVLGGLQVDAARMRANIDALGGFPFAEALAAALADALGRPAAQARIEALCRDAAARGQTLLNAIERAARDDALLAQSLQQAVSGPPPAGGIATLFDPMHQLRGAHAMTDAVLAQWRATRELSRPSMET